MTPTLPVPAVVRVEYIPLYVDNERVIRVILDDGTEENVLENEYDLPIEYVDAIAALNAKYEIEKTKEAEEGTNEEIHPQNASNQVGCAETDNQEAQALN